LLRRFLRSRYVGRPQYLAAALLGVYLLQCLWLAERTRELPVRDWEQALRIYQGLQQWRGGVIAGLPGSVRFNSLPDAQFRGAPPWLQLHAWSPDRSPLYYLIAGAPFVPWPRQFTEARPLWPWLALTPYLFFGVMLGGSLWYVARRLYGNAGGYIALLLYCFSPAMILNVAAPGNRAEMGAVWGAFGAVFTAIAVAHTLYAPREVVLWNWRRILLLGLSFVLAVGNQFSLAILLPVALLLMLWVAPVRPWTVLGIFGAAAAIAFLLLLASYFFRLHVFWDAMALTRFFVADPQAFASALSYRECLRSIWHASPPLAVASPAVLLAYFSWKRARYFGNTVPLLMAVLCFALSIGSTQFYGACQLAGVIFLFVFVAGVLADLLETRYGLLVMAALGGVLIASALWNVVQLARLGM